MKSPIPQGIASLTVATGGAAKDSNSPNWWRYHEEILAHWRLPARKARSVNVDVLDSTQILLVPAAESLNPQEAVAVRSWVEHGGVLVAVGCGPLGEQFGITSAGTRPEGRVRVCGVTGWADPVDVALFARAGHQFNAPEAATLLASWDDDGSTAALLYKSGAGVAVFLGADVWQSIVALQQGDPVRDDGVPALDGTAPVDDGVLKCDDGIVLDYERDRALPADTGLESTDGRAGLRRVPVFHRPHADLWRRLLAQLLIAAARHTGAALPWVHPWPHGVPAVAHLSVDSDRNSDEDAATSLDLFSEIDVPTTWCHVYPGGYSSATLERIGSEGHEHALHYNAVGDADIATWGWPQLRAQHAWAQALTGVEHVVTNKNHYTRWEGWDEFYRWCARLGIEIDETRGPSKRGNVGFPFGTCQLAKPLSRGPEPDVLMLPLHAQDLAWATHESVRDVILDQAAEHDGVAHFLFHPVHLHRRAYVRDACRAVVAEARRRGMPWWTAAQLNAWERLRRTVELTVHQASPLEMLLHVHAAEAVRGLTILVAGPDAVNRPQVCAPAPVRWEAASRFGRSLHQFTTDIEQGDTVLRIRWHGDDSGEEVNGE